MNRTSFRRALVPGVAALVLTLSACGPSAGTRTDAGPWSYGQFSRPVAVNQIEGFPSDGRKQQQTSTPL